MAGRFFAWLAAVHTRRPFRAIALCAVLAVVSGALATRLELRTRFDQLLPDHQPSVVELRRLEALTGGSQNVFVVLQDGASARNAARSTPVDGEDDRSLRAMGDALVPRLRAIGAPWVTSAEDGPHEARAFLLPRAALFAKTADLRALRDEVEARWDWEIGRETGSNLDDDRPPDITAAAVRSRFGLTRDERFPDGYYQSKDGRALIVIARAAIGSGELDREREALARIEEVVGEVVKSGAFARVKVSYAGDLVTGLSEYGAVKDDLVNVGALGVGLVLGAIFLFFLRLRVLVAMGLTMGVGLAATFGLTELAIGHLNVATGFLVSIVAGNGINFGIVYASRFYEELRGGASRRGIAGQRTVTPEEALRIAVGATWPATLTAALAAAASYGSLGVTDFLAFKHFAFIGSAGMLTCWVATYAMLPPLLLVFERARPFAADRAPASLWGRLRLRGLGYGAPFALLVERATRPIVIGGLALASVGFALLVGYVRADPMEYDMRRLQNDLGAGAEMYRASKIAADVLGARLEGAMVVLTDRIEQVLPLKSALEARSAAAGGEKPFEAIHTLFDFVPDDQPAKLPLATDLRERLVRARERGLISDPDWADLGAVLPPEGLVPWTLGDLPEELARPFTERDGTRGRLVLIEPTAGKSDADLRYLLRWADSFRETHLADGSVVRGSGRAVIFADMLRAVGIDMPRAIAVSLGMTIFAVVATFGRGARSAAVLMGLAVGLGFVAAAMAASHLKITFLNFIALPITFGIGVDYAVNVVQRQEADRGGPILDVLRSTGGAVILCSLTTTLGYLALLGSINQAIRGLGLLAVFGEVACLVAAVLVLPAALLWRERSERASRARSRALARGGDHPTAT